MRKIGIAAFTDRGRALAGQIEELLLQRFFHKENVQQSYDTETEFDESDAAHFSCEILRYEHDLKDWCASCFAQADGIIFIGACGIAVRTIAPFLKSKTTDPAVLVIDEAGQYVISLLSGHIGGANEFALQVASLIEAVPVITTASDVNGRIAVDVFAKKNHLAIGSMRDAKKIAAAILRGERVGVCCSGAAGGSIEGRIPPELILLNGNGQQEPDADQENTADSQNLNAKCVPEKCDSGKCDPGKYFPEKKVQHLIWISERLPGREAEQYLEDTGGTILHLIPRTVILGIGCRKGKMQEEIVRAAAQVLQEESISEKALVLAASIDLKKEEAGILGMCEQYEIPFVTYSAQQLAQVQGEFQSSEFVRKTTGVDNVCERSSLLAAGDGGRLIRKKYAENGVTAALAARKWRVRFEE